ncbi:hypothetical protein AALP_AA8G311500 [Arabis alpina]|uniref:Uncharacterized protein n=1 Tax=Arabis alpina TaxID=50452 RepID=A0A087GAM8_ARAAL|nr:hypothetical protein AALP_AA8G311500 [Arabis alpina]
MTQKCLFGRGSSSQPLASNRHVAPPPAADPPLAPPQDPLIVAPHAAEITLQRRYSRVLHSAWLNGAKCWRRVPLIDKEAWFSTFKTRFKWDDAYEPVVKANFAILAANRLRGMAANDEDCSFLAVMKKTHQKPDGSYVDNRAREIAEKIDEHVEVFLPEMESCNGEPLTVDARTVEEMNEIYVKIARMSKQGRVFGLGSLQLGISSLNASAASSQAVEDTGTLTREVEELKNELQKSREENLNFQKQFETMEQIVQSLSGKSTSASSSLGGDSGTTPP